MTSLKKYIKKIYRLNVEELNKIMSDEKGDAYIFQEPTTELIGIVGLAQLDESSKLENRTLIFSQKLSATLCGDYDLDYKKHAFILESVEGDKYIMGTKFAPYCIESLIITMPENPGSKASTQLEVTYSGLNRLKKLIN